MRTRLRSVLPCCGVLAALSGVTAIAMGPGRAAIEPAAHRVASAPGCAPATLNGSAVLPGTALAVSPLPGSRDASPLTQISLLGAPRGALGRLRVSGSRTGSHGGRLLGYSQGDGASFVPSHPFSPGETVTVRGAVSSGPRARTFAYRFVVAGEDVLPYTAPHVPSEADPHEVQHFRSRPELKPPALLVTARSPQTAPGYIFAAPYGGPGKAGPLIFDDAGSPVWFHPLPVGTEAANLQVQPYGGQALLTWWQGYIPQQGFGEGEDVIADGAYRQIGRVHAGNGYKADLHAFRLTARGTALISVFDPVDCRLSAVWGPRAGAVTDSGFQEIDLRTGLVRREWHALDHVPLADSYGSAAGSSRVWPFDYFHINSIDPQPDGTMLISARNTSTLYRLNTLTGQVLTRIGGRRSDVRLAPGAATAFQHDATVLPDGTISIFDNGASPRVHAQSRGLVVRVDPDGKSDAVVDQYEHPAPLSASSQGSLQVLENGDAFIGWGSAPFFSEFTAGGQLLFDAHMRGAYQSYRGSRFTWTGAPSEPPAVAALPSGGRGPVTVYASWNGDTRTASWRVLAGPSAQRLASAAGATRTGFETAIALPGPAAYVAVQALDASGTVLGTSRTIPG